MKHLIIITLAALTLFSCNKKALHTTSTTDHTLTAEDFPAFIVSPGTLNIVDFTATWCAPCQQLKPILASVADENSASVKLGAIDVDKAKSLAAQKGVQGIPDVRFFINGKQVDQFTGAAPREHIEQIIARLLAQHEKELKNIHTPETTAPETPTPISPAAPAPAPTPAPTPEPAPISPPAPAATKPTESTPQPIQPAGKNSLPPGMSRGK